MRFLADECCDYAVLDALRAAGHDVAAVSDISPRATDDDVIALAARADRTLLTEEQNFAQKAFNGAAKRAGVVIVRFRHPARPGVGQAVVDLVARHGVNLHGRSTVLERSTTFRIVRGNDPRPFH